MSGSILYIHGFNSSPLSTKARQLEAVMQRLGLADQLRVPALHHHPRQAIAQLEAAIAELGAPLLVGSSLGGYYATCLAERHGLKALLVNPAVTPHKHFDGYLGTQRNHYTDETWELTLDHVQALAELEVPAPVDASVRLGLPPDRRVVPLLRGAVVFRQADRAPKIFLSSPPSCI